MTEAVLQWSAVPPPRAGEPTLPALALTVLYDGDCAFCVRCRSWLEHQITYVHVRFVAAQSAEARERFAGFPWLGAELVVVDEWGRVWVGPAAFLMCLWATRRYREWGARLSAPTTSGMAEQFFHAVSSHRRGLARIAELIRPHDCRDGECLVSG